MTFFEYPHARRGRAGDGMVHRVVWRVGSADALDFWERAARRRGRDDGARPREPALLRPRRARPRAGGRRDGRRAARRRTTRTSRPSSRSRASTACAPTRSTRAEAGRSSRTPSASNRRQHGLRGPRRAARVVVPLRRAARPSRASAAPAPSTTSPGRRCPTTTRRGSSGSHAPEPGRRRSSTASTSSRSTSASRAASCSRSPRSGPASRPTSRSSSLGERLSLPPDFEHLRAQVEPLLTPLPNPRG